MMVPLLPAEGQEIEVECERIAYGGLGVARTPGRRDGCAVSSVSVKSVDSGRRTRA